MAFLRMMLRLSCPGRRYLEMKGDLPLDTDCRIVSTQPIIPGSEPAPKGLVVAIDGPAGAGKSTVARALAARYGLTYINTGAMYRCVALASRHQGISPVDGPALGACARAVKIAFRGSPAEGQRVFLDGEDVTEAIVENEISALASQVSLSGEVRHAMIALQREMGRQGRVVMEGRDIGTVVFPDATVKVFLTASSGERGRRRARDLATQPGNDPVDQAVVEQEIMERDRRDSERELSPLRPAPDAVCLNSDGLSVGDVILQIAALLPAGICEKEYTGD